MKLHLGCGSRFIEGYTHIDAVFHPHVDVIHAIDTLPMVADNSVDVIYACHVLEHFHRRRTVDVLREWFRVLKVGGTLRVAVPDFPALIDLYKETGDLTNIIGPLYGRQDYVYNIHYTAFDMKTLEAALKQAGFHGARRYNWRKTEHANVDDFSQSYYPHMDKAHGRLLSLNVEATK